MKIQILDEAERDLVEGCRFYESQAPGLGEYFLDSLLSDVDSLQFRAGCHGIHFGYRRLLSKRTTQTSETARSSPTAAATGVT